MILLFWICLSIVIYTFIGYGAILLILIKIKKYFIKKSKIDSNNNNLPTCSILIAAYNEEAFISQKILNTLSLSYPPELLKIFIVADGSTDQTTEIIKNYPEINLLYSPLRRGKVHAINRAMEFIDSETIVFTDANTFLNKDALINICRNYKDPNIGCVAGEKRIFIDKEADASTAGESMYWKYESTLKRWDSELNMTIGAAGELFSIRRTLYEPVEDHTILDDFIISMRVATRGLRIVYEPNAYAIETSSASINEELKRKIRIAAGGIQSIIVLKDLLNPFKYPLLSFQYISHRVLRWSIVPFLLLLILPLNVLLTMETPHLLYSGLLISQIIFYSLAIVGLILEKRKLKFKITFIPYYFCIMNYSVIIGTIKYFRKRQSSIWEKAKRKKESKDTLLSYKEVL